MWRSIFPSSILRHYDVLIDFPGRKFSIGAPGTIHFRGPSGKVQVNAENGLIQVPSQIENKKYNLALDIGSSISFLSEELFDKLAAAHADWPHMTGAVGLGQHVGRWTTKRNGRSCAWIACSTGRCSWPTSWSWISRRTGWNISRKRAGVATAGLLGSNALLNYRVGLDYAHSTVYFEYWPDV